METSVRRLNLGCGEYKTAGCINIDRNPSMHPDLVRDITKGLPFDSSSAEYIRAGHILEHLPYEDLMFVLEECYRVLTPNGELEIVVPLGNTGFIDHKLILTSTSFDQLLLPEVCTTYHNVTMHWEQVEKTVFKDMYSDSMILRLKAIKG